MGVPAWRLARGARHRRRCRGAAFARNRDARRLPPVCCRCLGGTWRCFIRSSNTINAFKTGRGALCASRCFRIISSRGFRWNWQSKCGSLRGLPRLSCAARTNPPLSRNRLWMNYSFSLRPALSNL